MVNYHPKKKAGHGFLFFIFSFVLNTGAALAEASRVLPEAILH